MVFPSKFTPKRRRRILKLLREGNFLCTAGALSGLGLKVVDAWKSKGKREFEAAMADDTELTEHAQFYADILKAEAKPERAGLKKILGPDARPEDIRWWMGYKFPTRWGRKTLQVELSGPDGDPIDLRIDAQNAFAKALTASLEREGLEKTDPESSEDPGPEGGAAGPEDTST